MNRAEFLIIICFSFFNFLFTRVNLNLCKEVKIRGHVFVIPFMICSMFFVQSNTGEGHFMESIYISEGLMLLWFLIVPVIKKDKHLKFIIYMTTCIVGVVLYVLNFSVFLDEIKKIYLVLVIMLIILNVVLKKNRQKFFYQGLIALMLSYIFAVFNEVRLLSCLEFLFKIVGYFFFFTYFSKENKISIERIKKSTMHKEENGNNINDEYEKELFYMQLKNERLQYMSTRDKLTQAYNKGATLSIIDTLIKNKSKFTLLMYDIDNFKKINDVHGHICGDKAIRDLSNISKRTIRENDYLGRYGGDEFILVLTEVSLPRALKVAERLRENVKVDSSYGFTISVGAATFPQDGSSTDELIEIADQGLYISKKKGKNAVSYNGRVEV